MYIELVLLFNFFLDSIILLSVNHLLKRNIKLFRIILGSIVGSLTIFTLFIDLNNILLVLLKFILSILIIIVTFGKKEFIKNIEYFYLVSIILGGSLYLLDLNFNTNIILVLLISPIVLYIYYKDHILYKNTFSNLYPVNIYIKNKAYNYCGYLDTGNTLVDPYTKKSIVLVSKLDYKYKNFILVPFNCLNSKGLIKCIKVDSVRVGDKNFKNCLVGISNNEFNLNGADCILPNKYKEDLI